MADDKSMGTEWEWVYSWAGGVHGLVGMLHPATPADTFALVLDSLDLLVDAVPLSRRVLVDNAGAVEFMLGLPGPRHALQVVLEDSSLRSHPTIQRISSSQSSSGLQDARRLAAWSRLEESPTSLATLNEVGPGDVTLVDEGKQQSRLARLLDMASDTTKHGPTTLEDALDILKVLPEDQVLVRAMVPPVTRLIVLSRMAGSDRVLPFGVDLTRPVLKALVGISTQVMGGASAHPTAVELAKPYMAHVDGDDPLRLALSPRPTPSPQADQVGDGDVLDLLDALQSPTPTAAITVSPETLLGALCPAYLAILRSAPIPPLGIRSTIPPKTVGSQASAFGGKVYTQHEFRGKDMFMPQGLGSSTAFSRPASKHVDDYVV